MSKWRVFFLGEDITAKVSQVRIRWQADAICGECEVSLADRTGFDLWSMDWRELRAARTLPIRVEEWVPAGWVEGHYTEGGWINGAWVESVWVEHAELPARWELRGEFLLDQIRFPDPLLDVYTATLWGRSKPALLGAPFVGKISKQWTEVTGTTDIMQGVAMPYGVDVRCPLGPWLTYDDTIDPKPRGYPICAGCYAVDRKTPADIIRELMDLAGFRIAPWSDGSLRPWQREYPKTHYVSGHEYIVQDLTIEPPDSGARILITSERPPAQRTIVVKPLLADEDIVPGDGKTQVRLLALVWGEGGEDGDLLVLSERETLAWTASDGTIPGQGTSAFSHSHGYIVEYVRATQFNQARLRFPAKNVAAVYSQQDHVPGGFGPGHPPVSHYPPDTGPNNLMESLGGVVTKDQITFTSNLPFYDQELWVLYEPAGYPNVWTAGARPGPVEITATLGASRGSCTIRQGVPGAGNKLIMLGEKYLCFGSGPVPVTILGHMFGLPATGYVSLSMEGCGRLSSPAATFGPGTITETLIVEESGL